MQRDGRELLYFPLFNYSDGNLDPTREMLLHPRAALGLVRRRRALRRDLRRQHADLHAHALGARPHARREAAARVGGEATELATPRELYGLDDRGVLAPGMKADLNVIDLQALELLPPEVAFDLPAGGRRLLQGARGYEATIVSGRVIFENGEPTGALPGRLVRGAQPAPSV